VSGLLRNECPECVGICRDFKAILYLGIFVTSLSSILFILYIYQLGNFSGILKLNYSDYVSFLSYSDPRFAATSIIFLPVGLLLLYIGLRGSSIYKKQRYTCLVVSGLILFSFWLLWVGNRGTAMLSLTAILYLSHLRRAKRIPYWQVALIVLVGSLTIAVVKQFRDVPISLRSDLYFRINPLDGLVELGGIFLPYHGFIKLFSSEMVSRMGINPYLIAIMRLVPNLGTMPEPIEYTEYFRSNIWITQILAPQALSVGIGLGSSGIGEPYACFGYFGVVFLFLVIAFFIVKLEMSSLLFSSAYTSGLIAFLFIPMNWYIRDDIFGTLRPVAWGCIAVFITAFLAGRKKKSRP
jgi:oligosaccharide repeat unit polymerase